MRTADRLLRSFVTLHVIGPLFGLPICAALLVLDKSPDMVAVAFTLGVSLFALFPLVTRHCETLEAPAFASVQLLTFISLFGSYFYGGLNSPLAVWLIVAVLLSFMFVRKALGTCLAAAAVQAGLFLGLQALAPAEPRLGAADLGILFLISTFAAALYVSIIAAFYSRINTEGSELAALARRYEEAARRSQSSIDALVSANQAATQFIAKASHELRTSLNVVIGYSELLTEDAEAGERWARLRNLEKVIGSSRTMIGIIADVAKQADEPPAASADAPADPTAEEGGSERAGEAAAGPGDAAIRPEAAWWLVGIAAAILGIVHLKLAAAAPQASGMLLLAAAAALGWQAARIGRRPDVERDPLTGLPNRIAFQRELDLQLQAAGSTAAVLFADLDGFKEINDSLGHDVGDQLLVKVADRLVEILPPGALLARLGGDEFAAAIFGPGAEAAMRRLADAFLEAMTAPIVTDEDHLMVSVSIGLAHGETHSISSRELLRQSDIAMYRAKRDKRCPIRSFETEMDETLGFRRAMRQDLARALAGDELDLHLQPVVDARTGALASAEALLRWTHPVLGPISPAKLVALAEESGQIIDIDDWVLERALDYARRLGPVPVAINISPVQFRHPGFARKIVDRLEARSVPADRLRLEITEGVLVTHMRAASRAIAELREAGLRIALDDFGTGFSSLGYLKDFRFDFLKVDRSFVTPLEDGRQSGELLRAIVDLGHSLGMSVIAEGVETAGQAALVQLLGCDYIQGYFTGHPLALEEFEQRLAADRAADSLAGGQARRAG